MGSIGWFNTYLNNIQIASFSYEYYPDGTVRSATETMGQGGSPRTWEWDYYEDGSLKYESASHLWRRDYSYDLGGNLNRVPAQMNTPASYKYNKLISIGNWTFDYTRNGERSEERNNPFSGNWSYQYDIWGNLTRASRNGQVVYEAKYDAFGNRVWAQFQSANGTTRQRYYLYEGDTLVAELDEFGTVVAEYVWGQLGPVARIERVAGQFYPVYRVQLYVLDGLGHVRGLVGCNDAGSWRYEQTYDYDSWGNLLNSGVPSQPFLWNGAYGYEYIPATGLYHVGAREYDPRTGRWLQRDPSDAESGDPNSYRFCGNDPVNQVDPDGEDWLDFVPIIGSGRDLLEGIREGDWGKIAMGAGGLLLDITSGGTGSLVKGIIKGGVKIALRQGAKQVTGSAVKKSVQSGAKASSAQAAKKAPRKTVKHHIMTNKNYKRGKKWSKEFENLLDKCDARDLLNSAANLVEMAEEEHRKRAPHSEGYHSMIYEAVKKIVDRYKHDPKRCRKELEKLLKRLGRLIRKKPELLRSMEDTNALLCLYFG